MVFIFNVWYHLYILINNMLTINVRDLKENIDKYIELAQEEEIEVVEKDKVLFYITPKSVYLLREWEKLFGSLPREAYYDDDIDRE